MNVHANDQQRLREIFCAVRQQATDSEKSRLLDQLCVGNESLRSQVEQLLAAASNASPVDRMGAMLNPTELEFNSAPGERQVVDIASHPLIGPYKLLEQIGEGGMGTVFMAVQSQPIKRKVALKIIKSGMDTGQVIARFEVERQALAMMNHPNIAKVLDAGATETGRPYFVMELVRGIPITEFCDLHKLDLRQRLEMFSTVCQAVQHAHQKGIIHRDLKPSNILVELQDVTPVPKVIDFGVAKPIHEPLTERTLHTGFAQMIGTPLYMSPEQTQLSSLDVDTRSDVYSLGMLLYEMLTGSTPFDRETLKQAGFDEMRRIIREDEPQKPSERISTLAVASLSTISDQRNVEPRRLSFSHGGELDWIVMKALEKDRARRYESASAFAQDVQRFLNDEPVQACPPTILYRLGKIGRRNKVAFAFSSLLVASLLMGVAGLSIANRTLARSQQAAETSQQLTEVQRRLAEQHYTQSFDIVHQFLGKITEWNLSEQPGMEQYRVQLLEAADGTLVKLLESRPTDEQALHLRCQVLFALALDYTSMERLTDALNAYQNAVANADQLVEKSVVREAASRSLTCNIRYSYSFLLARTGHLNEAIDALYVALGGLEREVRDAPENKIRRGQLSNVLRTLSEFEALSGNALASQKHLQQASELFGIRIDDDLQLSNPILDSDIESLFAGGILHDPVQRLLISLAERQKNPELQFALWRQAMNVARDDVQKNPSRLARHQLAFDLGTFAGYLHRVGNLEEALQSEQESVTIMERLTAEFPTFAAYPTDLLRMQMALEGTLVTLTRHDEALTLLNHLAEQHPTDLNVLERRGILYADHKHDAKQALLDYDRMIESAGDQVTAHQYRLRGNLMASQMGNFEDAIVNYDRAIELDDKYAWSYEERANAHLSLHHDDLALSDFSKAIELQPDSWYIYKRRAACNFRMACFDQTLVDLQKAVEMKPADLSTLTWIPAVEIAACPDPEFREGMITLADHCVELNSHSMASLIERTQILAELGESQRAKQDLNSVVSNETGTFDQYYKAALLSLKLDDLESYNASCRTMLKTKTAADKPIAKHSAAWTCALAPNALENYADAVALGRAAVEAEPTNPQFLNGLGAVLMRGGLYAEAMPYLEGLVNIAGSEDTSKTYTHYFLAMTEHHLGNADAARAQLKAANELADAEVAGSIPWNRRLTIELLQKEVEAILSDADK